MGKHNVRTYDAISPAGLDRFGPDYQVGPEVDRPDAIMLRSHSLHNETIDESVVAIGRAGAGVNNIPVEAMADRGVVVFNAPGANANSVKELVIAGLLLSARNLPAALNYAADLPADDIKKAAERGKKQFAGLELAGSTLGVIGLGAIGHRVANTAVDLGMRVVGYDPVLSPQHESQLSALVHRVHTVERLIAESDYVTLHVPLLDDTRDLINAARISQLNP